MVSSNNDLSTPFGSSPGFVHGPLEASPLVTPPERKTRRQRTLLWYSPQNPFCASPLQVVPESDREESANRGLAYRMTTTFIGSSTMPDVQPHREQTHLAPCVDLHNARCTTTPRTDPSRPLRGPKLSIEPLHLRPTQAAFPKLLFLGARSGGTRLMRRRKRRPGGRGRQGVDVFTGGGHRVKPRNATALDKERSKGGER